MKPIRRGKSNPQAEAKSSRQVASVASIDMGVHVYQPTLQGSGGVHGKLISHTGQRSKVPTPTKLQPLGQKQNLTSRPFDKLSALGSVHSEPCSNGNSPLPELCEAERIARGSIGGDCQLPLGSEAIVKDKRIQKQKASIVKGAGRENAKRMPGKMAPQRLVKLPGVSACQSSITTKAVLPEINKYERLLMGNMDSLPPQRSSMVRIFLSSTFSDFRAERNALTKVAYPQLQSFCAEKGLDFQVMDMRWGITDDATNDHSVEAICLQEIANCQRLSCGPNFVAMLGDRYGYRPLIPQIESQKFEIIQRIAKEDCEAQFHLLEEWYIQDCNSSPPEHVLQPIRSRLKYFGDTDPANKELRAQDAATWSQVHQQLHHMFLKCITLATEKNLMDTTEFQLYSVTEREVQRGILTASAANSTCLAILRQFEGAGGDLNNDRLLTRHTDVKYNDGKWESDEEAQMLRKTLKTVKIPSKLSKINIHSYTVAWQPGAINPQLHSSHQDYITKLCGNFVTHLKASIEEVEARQNEEKIKECNYNIQINPRGRGSMSNATMKSTGQETTSTSGQIGGGLQSEDSRSDMLFHLMAVKNLASEHKLIEDETGGLNCVSTKSRLKLNEEILYHLHLCKDKCESFGGRKKELESVRQRLCQKDENSKYMYLILHAPSGCGKTAFMAKVATEITNWFKQPMVNIIRFLGTSPQSSKLILLLRSICQQICLAYGEPYTKSETQTTSKALKYFKDLLIYTSVRYGNQRPLVVILDSLDQVECNQHDQWVDWFPHTCPPNVHLIASLIPSSQSHLIFAQEKLHHTACFQELEIMDVDSMKDLAQLHLKKAGRQLTAGQLDILYTKLQQEPNVLLLKLWLDQACTWRSYSKINCQDLPAVVDDAICGFFQKLEKKYGKLLIESALGYITLCKDGITEIELEDVLSCNDEVLNEVYRYHDPPVDGVVRIPSLIWARMKHDLGDYVVERQAYSKRMLGWYHRQFHETARLHYGSGTLGQQRHRDLANLFLVEDHVCRIIELKQRHLTVQDADRLVSIQPMSASNRRKLLALPFHLVHAGDHENLQQHIIFNFHYLMYCFQSSNPAENIREVLAYIKLVERQIPDVSVVTAAVKFSLALSLQDSDNFPIQIMGQLLPQSLKSSHISNLLEEASNYLGTKLPALKPLTGFTKASSSNQQWYVQGPCKILTQSHNLDFAVVAFPVDNTKAPLCQVLNMETGETLQTLSHNKNIGVTSITQAVFSHNSSRVYALCKQHCLIFPTQPIDGATNVRVQQCKTNKNNGDTNSHIAISICDQYLVVAGSNCLLMLEDEGKTQGEPDFKVRNAMNLTGATVTSNLMYTSYENMTVSSHAIKGEKKTFGAIVLWEPTSKVLKTRVALPSPVSQGFLFENPVHGGDYNILAGCDNGQIFLVDMNAGAILKSVGNPTPVASRSSILTTYDPSSRLLLVCPVEQTIVNVWDTQSWKQLPAIESPCPITAVAVRPGKNQVLIGNMAGNLQVFGLDNGFEAKLLHSLVAHEGRVTNICCRENHEITTGSSENCIRHWNMEDGFTVANDTNTRALSIGDTLEEQEVETFAVTSNSMHLITGALNGLLLMWNLKSGTLKETLASEDKLSSLEISHAHDLLLAVKLSGGATCWDLKLPAVVDIGLGEMNNIRFATFAPNDQLIVLAQHSRANSFDVCVIDINTKQLQRSLTINEPVTDVAQLQVTRDGQYLICWLRKIDECHGCQEFQVKLLDLTQDASKEKTLLEKPVYQICPLKSQLILVGQIGEVKVIDVSQVMEGLDAVVSKLKHTKCRVSIKSQYLKESPVCCLVATQDATFIASGTENGQVVVWKDILHDRGIPPSGMVLKGHKARVLTMAFTTSTNYHLVTGSKDCSMKLWDVSRREPLRTVHLHAHVNDVEVSHDNEVVVVATKERRSSQVSLWKFLGLD